jgi:dTDP-4-dehydrorhamnose reductase
MKNHYLILGEGRLSAELRKQTNWDYVSMEKDGIDFTVPNSYKPYVKEYPIITNCIACTDTKLNKREPHWSVNYVGVIDLVNMCNEFGSKLIQISTDYLYANSVLNASEEDVPSNLNNWYTYTKLLADGYVQAKCINYLLIRTSFKLKPYPWNTAWTDIQSNADYVDIIAKMIIELIHKNAIGVYNVGTETKTFFDLAKQTAPNCIPILDDHSFIRPHNVTMNLTKLKNKLNEI